jgi:prophage tail gpP-like protein
VTIPDDQVSITLGGDTIAIVESYEIRQAVIEQPAKFTLRLGHGGTAKALLDKYPPHTKFQIKIGDRGIQTGFTDGFVADDSNGATEISFEGRDLSAALHDTCIVTQKNFASQSYSQLVETALTACGLEKESLFSYNNADNRKVSSGVVLPDIDPPYTILVLQDDATFIDDDAEVVEGTKRTVFQSIKTKIGQTWYEFLKPQLDMAGLFLWAAGAEGQGFILAAPNGSQNPAYRIIRRRGQTNNGVNVLRHSYRNNFQRRYTKCVVYGHGGGRNFGRTKNRGEWVDKEASTVFGGDAAKPLVIHDNHVRTAKQAAFMARRKIAEFNRESWQLNYTVAGHTTPSMAGGGKRAVWTPDTTVDIDDDELGIKGLFYVEGVTFSRSPFSTTTLHVMRVEDLVFGEAI